MLARPLSPRAAFWSRLAFHALWLHGAWEAAQCRLFYDMSGTPAVSAFGFMAGATGADVFLTMLLVALTLCRARLRHRADTLRLSGVLALGGALTALLIEILAQTLGWWRYSPSMPMLRFFAWHIGFAPVLQMAVLPPLAVLLARPFTLKPK